MTDVNFQPIFDYIDEKHSEVVTKLDELQGTVHQLQASVDGLAKLVKDFRDEHIVIHHRLELLVELGQEGF